MVEFNLPKFILSIVKSIFLEGINIYKYHPIKKIIRYSIDREFINLPEDIDYGHIRDVFLSQEIIDLFENNLSSNILDNKLLIDFLTEKGIDERTLPRSISNIIENIYERILNHLRSGELPSISENRIKFFKKKYQLMTADYQLLRSRITSASTEWYLDLKESKEALKFFKKNKNKIGILHSLENIGKMYINLGDFQQAKRYLFLAQPFREVDDIVFNHLRLRIGWIEYHLGNYEEAENIFKYTLKNAIKFGDYRFQESSLHFLGKIQLQRGIYSKEYIENALCIFKKAKELHIGHNIHAISRCYLSLNEINSWRRYLA